MAYSKVILNGTTLIDVTQKTVTASTLLQGETALKNDGTDITGTLVPSVDPELQSKSVSYTPTTSQQSATITADGGYDGLSSVSVTVNAMPSGSASTPATSITANPTISVSASGLITASVSGSKSVTPSVSAGYVASGTAGTVSVSGSNTQQLSTQSAQTITPTTTNQTIASGKYLTGTQTILGDANLLAENIKKDVVIFGITGTHEGGGGGGGTITITIESMNFGFSSLIVPSCATIEDDADQPWIQYIKDLPANCIFIGQSTSSTTPTCSTGITCTKQRIYPGTPATYYYIFAVGDADGTIIA